MAKSASQCRRKIESKAKVKTGCATCRARKIKCDEHKPFCHKCVSTGRTCDGYESPFRIINGQSLENDHGTEIKSKGISHPVSLTLDKVTTEDIALLSRYFSTKTMFDVQLGCEEAARQVLQASRTDMPVRHAVWSLRALREDRETFEVDAPFGYAQQTPSYDYGVRLYSMALRGLALKLSSCGSHELKSALLCCQVFISIEQVRENYAAMGQHLIRGLRIMHAHHARPGLVAGNRLVPAHHAQLPLLDVFIIKLFAAPCKFAERPPMASVSEPKSSTWPILIQQKAVDSRDLRAIAPNMRAELIRIAALTIKVLTNVSRLKSVDDALQLLSQKAALLEALEAWLVDLEAAQKQTNLLSSGPLLLSFTYLFHAILKVILIGALDATPEISAPLMTANDQLQSIANSVSERIKVRRMCP